MTPENEVPHHHHRSGHRWIDLLVPISAIAISVISLVVAIHHGRTMRDMATANARLVEANSWPLLQFATGNAQDDGEPVIEVSVENAGVGPAKLVTLEVFYHDQVVRNPIELLAACCGFVARREVVGGYAEQSVAPPRFFSSISGPTVVKSDQQLPLLGLPKQAGHEDLWRRLDRARFELRFRACYCSVFDECWRSDLQTLTPERVEECPAAPDSFSFLAGEQSFLQRTKRSSQPE
ncbi:MAG: hypothetical protein ACREV5_02170 [Steroidobacter sp.]